MKAIAQILLAKKYWWLQIAIASGISVAGLLTLGMWTYEGAPPLAPFVTSDLETVISAPQINRGKDVFHLSGLASQGSFWGIGAESGIDFTADALHRTQATMQTYYENRLNDREITQRDRDAIAVRVRKQIHKNGWDEKARYILITDAQAYAYKQLVDHYRRMLNMTGPDDAKSLAAYVFWGGWAAGANRPGAAYSYTHNWPYDPAAGNTLTTATVLWSFLSILALFAGAIAVLHVYRQMKEQQIEFGDRNAANGSIRGIRGIPVPEFSTHKFFTFTVVLFLIQIVHMWIEVRFIVFTTCIVAYMLVQMGFLNRAMANRVIFLALMMFLVPMTVGIFSNLYWVAKSSGIIVLGNVFSALQVLPLLLMTLDAWGMRNKKIRAGERLFEGKQAYVMNGVWLIILAVNFWNVIGAGVFGSLTDLPIVNYFEHSIYLKE